MKSHNQKWAEALQRQEARDNRSDKEQLKILRKRPGKSAREVARLEARIKEGKS